MKDIIEEGTQKYFEKGDAIVIFDSKKVKRYVVEAFEPGLITLGKKYRWYRRLWDWIRRK